MAAVLDSVFKMSSNSRHDDKIVLGLISSGKVWKPLFSPLRFYCIIVVFLQSVLEDEIICDGWYAILQINQTKR